VPDMGFMSAKLAGVIAMFGAPMIWLLLPWVDRSPVRSATFRPIHRFFFWVLVVNCIVLGWCGANVPEGIYLIISRIATAYYFLHFLLVIPVVSLIEKPRAVPTSIAKPIFEKPTPEFSAAVAAGQRP